MQGAQRREGRGAGESSKEAGAGEGSVPPPREQEPELPAEEGQTRPTSQGDSAGSLERGQALATRESLSLCQAEEGGWAECGHGGRAA